MSHNIREDILAAGRRTAQAHGYAGLNFRELAKEVGVKAASIYYYFPSKAELAVAVAERYWRDSEVFLEDLLKNSSNPEAALQRYPETFRWALESDNRMCLCSFMSAEFHDLPEPVRREVQVFADVNITWLSNVLALGKVVPPRDRQHRARAIFAAIVGAQLMARSRSDLRLYDEVIGTYQSAGLLPR
ncbi:MAG: TetR/AcrR family transcriptional regulator [Janthinobacterium lividum]